MLRDDVAERLPATLVYLDSTDTEGAGHRRDLAREAAVTGRPLIVSLSGDGGYNEVVDGVMQAGNPARYALRSPQPNANAHHTAICDRPFVEAVVPGDGRRINLIRLTVGDGPAVRVRYAHSYIGLIGLGLTPVVASDRRRAAKGSCREIMPVGPSAGSCPSPSSWLTARGAASTTCCSPTSPRWPSMRRSARAAGPTTAGAR